MLRVPAAMLFNTGVASAMVLIAGIGAGWFSHGGDGARVITPGDLVQIELQARPD